MAVWEQVVIALLIVAVLFFFGPGAKKEMENSRNAKERDWRTVVIPLAAVVLFVILLIAMVQA